MTDPRPIPLWKIVAGIYLHVAFPMAIVAGAGIGVYAWTQGRGTAFGIWRVEALVNGVPLALCVAAATVAAVIDAARSAGIRRRMSLGVQSHPDNSRDAVVRSTTTLLDLARQVRGDRLAASADAIRLVAWDHDDPEYRRIADDLATAVGGMAPACASRDPQTRQGERERLAAVVDIIVDACAERERAVHAERDAAAAATARYVETKYRGDAI